MFIASAYVERNCMLSKKTIFAIILIFAVIFPMTAKADFVYSSKDQMIKEADVIAIVTINKINSINIISKDYYSSYNQQALARVEQKIKGEISHNIVIYNRFDPRALCPPTATLNIGRNLVFLKRIHNYLNPINFDLGVRPIIDNKIYWYDANGNKYSKKSIDIEKVVQDIQIQLSEH